MVQITIGYVAGFIAAVLFLVRIWAPTVLTFILSSILRDSNTAATWNIAAGALQRSHWPTFLQSDSAKSHGVRKDVLFLTWFISLMGALVAVAGIVSPLGLYEAVLESSAVSAPFKYVRDASPFGYGTPDRSPLPFTRTCGYLSPFGTDYTRMLSPCPFTDTILVETRLRNGSISKLSFPYGYDLKIPKVLSDIYSSGTTDNSTIANYFDIQWRRYQTTADELHVINNGSTYLIGAFRLMQSMALDNSIRPVEGLVVDMINGGIGLRNHTVPPGFEYGVSWEEDILFIEPETVCADTNTTLDYTIAQSPNATTSIINLVLTDRGGFTNINHTFPVFNLTAPQTNADLAKRAYKAAWLTNAYTMAYYNITNLGNATLGTHAFRYVNSHLNKTYQLAPYTQSIYYNSLGMDATFYFHLNLGASIANKSSPADSDPPSNPFGISTKDFADIAISCKGDTAYDFANITNIAVDCGIMRGVPQRVDDKGSGIQFDSGSKWSQPLYACASAVKASIKTVSFTYNSTSPSLSLAALNITGIKRKSYPISEDLPFWGVENNRNKYTNDDLTAIWGLISPSYVTHPNVSSVQQPHLYLPGFASTGSSLSSLQSENLPASDFYPGALGEVYQVGDPIATNNRFDYTGESNMAMWVRWQNLSNSASTASLIPNLIWADFAAAAVVGTKGVLGPGNTDVETPRTAPRVTPMQKKIRYHWPFAIPAFLMLFSLVAMMVALLLTLLFTRSGLSKMRHNLERLSPGKILVGFLYPDLAVTGWGSEKWSEKFGKTVIVLREEIPAGIPESEFELKERAANDKGNTVHGVYERAPSGSTDILANCDDSASSSFGGGPGMKNIPGLLR